MGSQRAPGTTDFDLIQTTELPYLTACPLGNRRKIVVLAYHDGSRFSAFVSQADQTFMVVNPMDMVGGHYFAKAPAHEGDVPSNLTAVVIQHYSFQKVLALIERLHADVVNALASVHRYFVMLAYANRFYDLAMKEMVATELEYAFANHRAFYDLMNRFIALFRFEPQYSAAEFRDSFRSTLEKTDDALVNKFGVPTPILAVIRSHQAQFHVMREMRDAILHNGRNIAETVFHLNDGFAVSGNSGLLKKLSDLNIWSPTLLRPNGLASVLPLLAFMARDIIDFADEIAIAILEGTTPPDPIAFGYGVFFRSPLTCHIQNLARYEREHWFAPEQVLELKERKQVSGNSLTS